MGKWENDLFVVLLQCIQIVKKIAEVILNKSRLQSRLLFKTYINLRYS